MSASPLVLAVNGTQHRLDIDPDTPLLTVLRDALGLKGSRFGCGQERCGACTVLIEGRPQHACRLSAATVAGQAVTTIEGLCEGGAPGPLQRLFIDAQAAQCGYCINGIIMTLAGLLQRRPLPARDELLHYIDERHLCRCGAHQRILRVIDRAFAAAHAEAGTRWEASA